jgi:probable addiction module antidote protein
MSLKLTKFEAAKFLKSEAHIREYLIAALEENDPVYFQVALGTVARARGMQSVAESAETTRAGLYKALSIEGNPEFATILRVVIALGYRLTVTPAIGRGRR